MDTPSLATRKIAELRGETAEICQVGFWGRARIQPAQIAVLKSCFVRSETEIQRARAIVEAFDESGGAAVSVDGTMVDKPIYDAANAFLAESAND